MISAVFTLFIGLIQFLIKIRSPFDVIKKLAALRLKKRLDAGKWRFQLHDPSQLFDWYKIGLLPQERELQLNCPGQEKNEDFELIGLNSWGQTLGLKFRWRPKNDQTAVIGVTFYYEDGNGNKYTTEAVDLVQNPKNNRQFKAGGLCLEVLSPFRRLRIRFRGFLKMNNNDVVFGSFRILWLSTSNVVDYTADHDPNFLAKELGRQAFFGGLFGRLPHFEDRFEQYGQFKGQIRLGDQKECRLFLWGIQSKRYASSRIKVKRLFGYSKKGIGFSVGVVNDLENDISYQFGFVFWGKTTINQLNELDEELPFSETLPNRFKFQLKSSKHFQVDVLSVDNNNSLCKITINGSPGRAIYTIDEAFEPVVLPQQYPVHLTPIFDGRCKSMVVRLDQSAAEDEKIAGGKGSSLASLMILSRTSNNIELGFEVPNGVVVTTNAYQYLIDSNKQISDAIENLKKFLKNPDELKVQTENIKNLISSTPMPKKLAEELVKVLKSVFPNVDDLQFAVRSSAVGEDSEVMSAAGQMTTFLGVRGMNQIFCSVINCWASQFDSIAVEYKRGYGQEINQPMAVVVQAMVSCQAAGVLFTCDPVSGDQRQVIITANHGLGESVVSALAEPDTIRLNVEVHLETVSCRNVEGIKSIEVGSKLKTIALTDDGAIEIDNENNECSISEDVALKLGKVALKISRFYGNDRDIEWGVIGSKIYIFQSRPVTNLDQTFTEFELMHEMDTGLPSEVEYISTANVGEVLPGCTSHLFCSYTMCLWMPLFLGNLKKELGPDEVDYCPYAPSDLLTVYNHFFFNMKKSEFMKIGGETISSYSQSMIYSIYGHDIVDDEFLEVCRDIAEDESFRSRFWKQFYLLPHMIHPWHFLRQYKRRAWSDRFVLDEVVADSREFYNKIKSNEFHSIKDMMVHVKITEASSMYNFFLISLLTNKKGDTDFYHDFAYLMSQCQDVISAEVPSQLREVAKAIGNPKAFNQMSDDKALAFLKSGQSPESKLFLKFLDEHGHRGYKEFDFYVKPWREEPLQLIKSLKVMSSGDQSLLVLQPKKSVAELMRSVRTRLSPLRRLLTQYLVLPLARRAVGGRENAKSCLIQTFYLMGQTYWRLAHMMVADGRLPEADLLFHLTIDELDQLMENRDPLLLAKAKHRKRLYGVMDKWKFDEICKGYDFQPRELMEDQVKYQPGDLMLTGTPVSHGKITGRACVAPTIDEAVNIRPGDILVTYSTDIGWSQYFPMITGIITEIGGLVSHGAVIAREYGIPCLVGVQNAPKLIRSGDRICIDCQEGSVVRNC